MAGLPHTLRLIQTVQNAAAPCHDNVTPCLSHSIHWLPAEQRAIFKTAVLVWLALYLHQLQMPVDVSQAVHQWRIHRGQGDAPAVHASCLARMDSGVLLSVRILSF